MLALRREAEELLGNLSRARHPGRNRPDFVSHTELAQKPLDQTHVVLSFSAPGYRNPEIYRLQVLSSLLGRRHVFAPLPGGAREARALLQRLLLRLGL